MRKILCALLGLILTLPVFAACPSGQVEQTYNWNQLWNAENISNLGGNLNVVDNNDGSFDLTVQQNAQYNSTQMRTNGSFIIGHKYVFAMDLTLLNDNNLANHSTQFRQCNGTGATFGAINVNFSATNETIHQMGLPFTATNAMSYMCFVIVTQFSYPEIDTSVRINNIQLYDLTAMFGAGNEPTTPEEAEQAISNRAQLLGIDRYVYNSGSQITACITPIKIATTAYNSARFSPVVTELNDTIATIRSVVTNTINQTKAIADLQATKQTRPDETCPAGKKCLLVEDNDGTPHWYEIIESANRLPNGYTELEYIESSGTQYIDTGITGSTNAIIDMQGTPRTDEMIVFMLAPIDATVYQNGFGQYQSTMSGSFDIATRRVYNVSYTSNSMTVNGVNVSNRYIANNVNLALFGSTATNRRIGDAKLYSAKIYNNDTLLRNFVPAKNSSGVIGMYDAVSGTFFTNAGTGTFVAGPEI